MSSIVIDIVTRTLKFMFSKNLTKSHSIALAFNYNWAKTKTARFPSIFVAFLENLNILRNARKIGDK